MIRPLCRICQGLIPAQKITTRSTLQTPSIASRTRTYATQIKNPRDRAIQATTINFIDSNGDFQGPHSLTRVLSSYDPSTHTLLNLTPTQEIPTCRLYTHDAMKDMQAAAYTRKKEKRQVGSDPGKVMKECNLSWTVTAHDLGHKLDSGLSALRKGNKLTVQIGTKFKRGAKAPSLDVKKDLVAKVVGICSEVGREWRAREGDLQKGVVLHYLGLAPSTTTTTTTTTATTTTTTTTKDADSKA